MGPLRVMIVDDHQVVREGLRMALEIEDDLEVVGEAGDGKEGVKKAEQLKPDLILMDIMMPGMNGIDACQEVRNLLPECRVVMLTASGDQKSWTASLMAGAKGYVTKTAGRDDLLRAIRAVGRGESSLDPRITQPLIEEYYSPCRRGDETRGGAIDPCGKGSLTSVGPGSNKQRDRRRAGDQPTHCQEYSP